MEGYVFGKIWNAIRYSQNGNANGFDKEHKKVKMILALDFTTFDKGFATLGPLKSAQRKNDFGPLKSAHSFHYVQQRVRCTHLAEK